MSAPRAWKEVLDRPAAGHHIVQTYASEDFLADAVCHYLGQGLARGDAAVVVATAAHRALFAERLAAAGIDVQGAASSGTLVLLDAEELLARFMKGERPDPAAFAACVGGVLEAAPAGKGPIRVYGEMVDVLWRRGNREAAAALEDLWNGLAKTRPFALFCAYELDSLGPGSCDGPLQVLCGSHSHLIPAEDYGRLERSVEEAVQEVLGPRMAGIFWSLSAEGLEALAAMPRGQAILLWLRRHMPVTAEKVLARARLGYQKASS